VSQQVNTIVTYLGSDDRNNVRLLLPQAGTGISAGYKAFGSVLPTPGTPATPFQYGGNVGYYAESPTAGVDDTEFYRTLHRIYRFHSGRFPQPDPTGINGGYNLYGYANNNPISNFDPSGERPVNGNDRRILHKLYAQFGKTTDIDGKVKNVKELEAAINAVTRAIKKAINDAPASADPPELRAALWAIDHLGDPDYGPLGDPHDGTISTRGGEWKCNIFAADSYAIGAGCGFDGAHGVPTKSDHPFHDPFVTHHWPPAANDLAASGPIAHFPIDAAPKPAPGDILAFGKKGHLGHTTIVLGGDLLIYAGKHGVKIQTLDYMKAEESPFTTFSYRAYRP
jgi:RHS repeat-associated protein